MVDVEKVADLLVDGVEVWVNRVTRDGEDTYEVFRSDTDMEITTPGTEFTAMPTEQDIRALLARKPLTYPNGGG